MRTFRVNYRRYEAWQFRKRAETLKARRHSDSASCFQVVKPERSEPLASIVEPFSQPIRTVPGLPGLVAVDEDYPEEGVLRWSLDGHDACVSRVGPGVYRVDCDRLFLPTSMLTCHCMQAEVKQIQEGLERLWKARWHKHKDTPTSQWDRIIGFARAYLPKCSVDLPDLSIEALNAALRRFKPKAARGPDGWSKADLINLPPEFQQDVVNMFRRIELIGQWPDQITVGLVHSLAKIPHAETVDQFRPITWFSMLYRCWASLRTSPLLTHLGRLATSTQSGFLPDCAASDVWLTVQASIEVAFQSDCAVCGVVADLVKAYNTIPREPCFQILAHLGVPGSLLRAWKNFLTCMTRRFVVRDDCGDAVASFTGFPEGCPLSCVAMVAIDLCWHAYQSCYAPSSVPFSFVDNLEILADEPGRLMRGFIVMQEFCSLLDLTLDQRKLYFWATSAEGRALLRAQGKHVLLAQRDLGGQMAYSAQHRNSLVTGRIKDVCYYLRRLATTPILSADARRCIIQALWPRAFHGCENVQIGSAHVDKLRSLTMKAIKWDKAGASPIASMMLVGDLLIDPGFFQFWTVLRNLRGHLRKSLALQAWWAQFFSRFEGRLLPGPFSKLVQQLHMVHWQIDAELNVWITETICLPFLSTPLSTWQRLAKHAWLQYLAGRLCCRADFEGLVGVSELCLKQGEGEHWQWMRTIRNGTFYTEDLLCKFDFSRNGNCRLCGSPDSIEHRACHCPYTADIRVGFQGWINKWNQLPRATREHGMCSQNPWLMEYWEALHVIDDSTGVFYLHRENSQVRYFFLDGTCATPEDPDIALAGWACIDADSHHVVSGGLLPGIVQNINRAELTALISAVKWYHVHGGPVVVWSDSSYVVDGFRQLQYHQDPASCDSNEDLWELLCNLLPQSTDFVVYKAAAHVDVDLCQSPLEEWVCSNNDRADFAAKSMLSTLPHKLYTARKRFLVAQDVIKKEVECAHSLLSKLSGRAFQQGGRLLSSIEVITSHPGMVLRDTSVWVGNRRRFEVDLGLALDSAPHCVSKYGLIEVRAILGWLQKLDAQELQTDVSLLEMYIAYVATTGRKVPVHIEGERWAQPFEHNFGRRTLATDLYTFGCIVRAILDYLEVPIHACTVNLAHLGVFKPFSGLRVGFSRAAEEFVGCWLVGFRGKTPIRASRDLAKCYQVEACEGLF